MCWTSCGAARTQVLHLLRYSINGQTQYKWKTVVCKIKITGSVVLALRGRVGISAVLNSRKFSNFWLLYIPGNHCAPKYNKISMTVQTFASNVFPFPGGPHSKMPEFSILIWRHRFGYFAGHWNIQKHLTSSPLNKVQLGCSCQITLIQTKLENIHSTGSNADNESFIMERLFFKRSLNTAFTIMVNLFNRQ